MPVLQLTTTSEAGTARIGAALAAHLVVGDVLVLSGDLGAGKTTFVRALARALDVADPVTSPTFTLLQTYEGRVRVHHLDAYRLEDPEEAAVLDLPLLLEDHAVVVVEWGEKISGLLPPGRLTLTITLSQAERPDARSLRFDGAGPRWQAAWPGLQASLC